MSAYDEAAAYAKVDDLIDEIGTIGDTADRMRDLVAELRGRLEQGIREVPPPARTFEVTDEDVDATAEILDTHMPVWAEGRPDPQWLARRVLTDFASRLAGRTVPGGLDATDDDVRAFLDGIRTARGVQVEATVAALLTANNERVSARTGGAR